MFIEINNATRHFFSTVAIVLSCGLTLIAHAQQPVDNATESAEPLLIPTISAADYEAALLTGENITFNNTPIPDSLRSLVTKTFSDTVNNTVNSNTSVTPQIIQGINASRNEYPEFVLMLIQQNGEFIPICGGTLIDDRKVLTAGHCSTFSGPYLFIPNFYSFNDFSAEIPPDRLFSAASRAIHPSFVSTPTRIDYDVAVFTLTRSANTAQATLYDGSSSLSGSNGTVIGVGLLNSATRTTPTTLQEVSTPVVSNSACQTRWGSGVQISSRVMCAGFVGSARGSCSGDSGGPLWVNQSGRRIQAGIVSFGPMDCANNSLLYGGYARISALASFIKTQAPGANFTGSSNATTGGSISGGSSSSNSTGSSTTTPPETETRPPVPAPIYDLLLD